MRVKIYTLDDDLNEVWQDGAIEKQWISCAWAIPNSNEINLIVGGFQLTVESNDELQEHLKTML